MSLLAALKNIRHRSFLQNNSRPLTVLPGGIRPPANKQQSLVERIQSITIPHTLVLPLTSDSCVQVGDKVLKAQLLTESSFGSGVAVHAPTSGKIIAIGDHLIPHESGLQAPCITIECDGDDKWISHEGFEDYRQHSPDTIIELANTAGIVGLGGAGFSTAIKLESTSDHHIDTLIVNACECEPYITADEALIRERSTELIIGAQILQYATGATNCIIAIENTGIEAIEQLLSASKNSDIEIVVVPDMYPSGGERQVIQITTGNEVPHDKLPADIGVVCVNAGTTYALYKAIVYGEPLLSRIITLTGSALTRPHNAEVLLGTSIRDLLQLGEPELDSLSKVIMGGAMMGFTVSSIDAPVIKTSNCFIATTDAELSPPLPATPCIRCGFCVNVCPVNLLPQQLYSFTRYGKTAKAQEHHLFDCIECGACSTVCPSRIELVQYFRAGKAQIKQERIGKETAEKAKFRFEAHQLRNARDIKSRLEKRQARLTNKEKTNTEKPSFSARAARLEIKAAVARVKAKRSNLKNLQDDST